MISILLLLMTIPAFATTETPVSAPLSHFHNHLIEGTFQQPIDHADPSGPKFDQRYWYDSEFASGQDAPVIYHICGEGNAEDGYFLNDNAVEWAKSLKAHLVYLEHRDYGKSIPGGDLSNDHLRTLTLSNVLEDLANFQISFTALKGWTGQWITVGGSYSGTLSALYRQAHPELIVGALASSAPMISGQEQEEGDSSDAQALSYTDAANDSGDRPWAYQACTTFGFWMASWSTIYHPSASLCRQVFGPNVPLVNPEEYNARFSAPFISSASDAPSNILFTYGGNDIWTRIGFTAEMNRNPNITIEWIRGAGHHYDLNLPTPSDSAAVKHARATFLSLAKRWLGRGTLSKK